MDQQFIGNDEIERENMQVLWLLPVHKFASEETADKCDQEVPENRG